MKTLIQLCILFILPLSLISQHSIEGRVVDEEGKGLPFVNITINKGGRGGTTDLDGFYQLESASPIKNLDFSYIGFEAQSLTGPNLEAKAKVVVLIETTTTLGEVTVLPGENPAHRMIENAVRNKEANDPEELDQFSYYSYSKFIVTLNLDSIDPNIDTVMLSDRIDSLKADQPDSIVKIDSSGFELHQYFSDKHLFFMETLTQRKFKRPRDNEEVIANRTSGFKNPMFAMLVTQLQSFSFYSDYIGISGGEYLNPISKGSTKRYYFVLEDSLFTETGDTIFTLSFRPRSNTGFKALQGVINIDSRDWAIVNVRATPASEESLPIEITQEYRRFGPHTWFPVSFEADIKLRMISFNKAVPRAIMRRRLMRIDLDPKFKFSDISHAELTIEEKDQAEVDSLLQAFRGDELDSLEANTYSFVDSISEAENFERSLNIFLTLSRGYIPIYYVNLDIGSVLNYNVYEGFRLGAAFETNERFHDRLKLGAFYAYGFKDKAHKYGGHINYELHKNLRWQVYARYKSDIFETSGFGLPGLEAQSVFQNNYRRISIEQWDYNQQIRLGMRIDPLPNVQLDLSTLHERLNTVGNYQFLNFSDSPEWFEFSEVAIGLRYAPAEEYAETPIGKIKLRQRYPVFSLHLSEGMNDYWEGDYNYTRALFQAEYKRLSRGYGETSIRLRAAAVWGDVPASKLFTPSANFRNSSDYWEATFYSVPDRQAFETMRFNEFLNDRMISLMWRQDFRSTFYKRPGFEPHLEMVHRIAFGTLAKPELHKNIGVKDLKHGYFESGLEFNRLYVSNLLGLGIGVYYRYGPNQLPEPLHNFAFKLSSKFSF